MVKLVRQGAPEPEPEKEATEPEPILYNADAAARILGGISTSMVYRFVHNNELSPVRLGSRTLFTREELERFVREKGRPQSE